MSTSRDPLYRRHRFPPEVISYAVWLYFRFPLSLRMVEEILAAARAEKAKGAAPAAPTSPPAAESGPAASEPQATESAPPAAAATSDAKVAPGGKGMSMADILAAARSKSGAASSAKPAAPKAPAAAKPAAEKTAAKPAAAKPAAASKDGNGAAAAPKDTASVLAAARKGAKPGPMSKSEAAAKVISAPAAKKKLDVPPMPPKPDYARPQAVVAAGDASTRRSFFAAAAGVLFGLSLAVGFTSLAVTHLMWLLGFARFMFPNILIEPPTRFKVGFPDAFSPGQVETKYIPQFGVWIVRYEVEGQPMIYALKSVCTHLGCTPNWLEAEQKFKCPCHGSGFYKDGINFEGPAPRPLERYAVRIGDDGQLEVDKSRTFQEELGQWTDPDSFVPV
jgi:cytochrome b6-f complex iron-sulfur subunit